ncbi:MAG TPA: DUF11 domain-containing protein [Chloroflexi bacterium]|nr:DUF11 domain-containing protein [Chloroflexota bacterium]
MSARVTRGRERFVKVFRLLALATLLLVGGGSAVAAPLDTATAPEPLSIHATIESVGIVAPYTGDDNHNNQAVIRYRRAGTLTWRTGPEMYADRYLREWRVSLVYLSPGTEYQIEVQYTDPDGVAPATVSGSIRTRPDYPDVGSGGNIMYVPDDGDLQTVIEAASPGDTIRLRAGVYHTSVRLEADDSGAPGHYLTIEAEPGAHVVLDGSDPDLNDPGVDNWHHFQGDIYYADLPWGDVESAPFNLPHYVGEQREGDDVRYLLYQGSGEWSRFLDALPGKAYYDYNGRLYVTTYAGDDPDESGNEMHVSRWAIGITLDGADYVRIRNLEFRYYGWYGIYLKGEQGADHNIIEGNTFHGIGKYHIRIGGWDLSASGDNLIQDNHFYERGYRDSGWTWDMQYDYAYSVGVRVNYAGPGNVIRRNTFGCGHDAIDIGWQSHDTDVYDNVIEECMDDGIEIDDQPGYNIRVWGNRIRYCSSGISNQDWFTGDYWNSGPVYIFRNVIEGGDDPQGRTAANGDIDGYFSNYAFKVGTDEDWVGRVYYYHNTIYIPDTSMGGNGVQSASGPYFSGLVTRNNLWYVRGRAFHLTTSLVTMHHDLDCDNLHNAGTLTDTRFIRWSDSGGPEGNGIYRNLSDFQAYTGQELHGISENGTRFNPDLSLQDGSPEIDAGCLIPGFNDRGPWAYAGWGPDIGAFEYTDVLDLSESVKVASPVSAKAGEEVTYTIRIVNTGTPLSATVVLTDTLPLGLDYVSGTLTATHGTAWLTHPTGSTTSTSVIHWQGSMGDLPQITVRYVTRVAVSDTLALWNEAEIADGHSPVVHCPALVIVNSWSAWLLLVLREW